MEHGEQSHTAHPPSFGSRLASNEKPEDEAVASPPSGDVVDDADADADVDVDVDVAEPEVEPEVEPEADPEAEPEVVDPDVVDADVAVFTIEPKLSIEGSLLEGSSSVGSSASCVASGTV